MHQNGWRHASHFGICEIAMRATLDESSLIDVVMGLGLSTAAIRGSMMYAGGRSSKDYSQTRIYWTKVEEFNNIKVYQRDDLIDANFLDSTNRTNAQRMKQGLAPLGPDGKPINLHHTTQRNTSSITEVTQSFHQSNKRSIHINSNNIPSGIDRQQFGVWKKAYWKDRISNLE